MALVPPLIILLLFWSHLLSVSSMLPPNYNETYPRLTFKSYKLFARNRTVNLSSLPVRLPRVYDELVFECNSSIPTKWILSGLQTIDSSVKKVEVSKWRSHKRSIAEKFRSTIRLSFANPTEFIDLFCENQCPEEARNQSKCQYMNSYVTAQENDMDSKNEQDKTLELTAFFHLRFGQGNKTTRTKNTKLEPTPAPDQGNSLRDNACDFTLHVDLELGTYECTRADDRSVEVPSLFIPCGNPDECDAISKTTSGEQCDPPVFERNCTSEICSELRDTATPFVLACGDDPKENVAKLFFKSLDSVLQGHKRLYEFSDRKNRMYDKMELIRVTMNDSRTLEYGTAYEKDPSIIHRKYKRQFTCTGLKSHFTYGFRWILLFKNNSTKDLGMGNQEYSNDTAHLYVSRKLIFFQRSDIIAVICEAPNWNSLHGTNSTLSVTVNNSFAPSFPNYPGAKPGGNITTVVVEKNNTKTTESLNCSRTGSPLAELRWILDGVSIKTEDSNTSFYYRVESPESSELTLLSGHPYESVVCEARNNAGTATVRFVYFKADSKLNKFIVIGIAVGAVFFVILVILIARRKIRQQKKKAILSEQDIAEFQNGNPEAADAFLVPYNMDLEVAMKNFIIGAEVLGSGAQGKVLKGQMGIMTVAVKTIKKSAEIVYLKALLSELKIMSYVGRHPNIVNLLGACTENIRKKEIYILLEYCERGSMVDLLRKNREIFVNYFESKSIDEERISLVEYQNASVKKLSTLDLVRWSMEIARGMEFLSSKNVIHGDLAGRNILITQCLNAKVSDFGLSKQLFEYSTYQQKSNVPLPLRWMAYESLKDLKFSVQSDIWSYGIVLWEIFSLGEIPYPGMEWGFESWKEILNGLRMEKPEYASSTIYNLMRSCWDLEPNSRPSFRLLKEAILDYSSDLRGIFGNYVL